MERTVVVDVASPVDEEQIISAARTRCSDDAASDVRGAFHAGYGSASTSPTLDDNGTAQLVNGVGTIRLDSTFAAAIDSSRPYQVMLTPDGDTRGLYVASKTSQGFIVREVQGGRSSISFDYHIYAPTLGHANDRMSLVNRYSTTSPRVTIVRPPALKPTRAPIRHN